MTKTPDTTDNRNGHFSQGTAPEESAATPERVILEIKQEQRYRREHTRRMAELKKMAILHEKVIARMLESSIEKTTLATKPHLTLVE